MSIPLMVHLMGRSTRRLQNTVYEWSSLLICILSVKVEALHRQAVSLGITGANSQLSFPDPSPEVSTSRSAISRVRDVFSGGGIAWPYLFRYILFILIVKIGAEVTVI